MLKREFNGTMAFLAGPVRSRPRFTVSLRFSIPLSLIDVQKPSVVNRFSAGRDSSAKCWGREINAQLTAHARTQALPQSGSVGLAPRSHITENLYNI